MIKGLHTLLIVFFAILFTDACCSAWLFGDDNKKKAMKRDPVKDVVLDDEEERSSVTSGKVFRGEVVRTFPSNEYVKFSSSKARSTKKDDCENWMVVTTIFKATEAVNRAVMMKNWCIVIVADTKTPTDYDSGWQREGVPDWSPRVEVLTPEVQTAMRNTFVDFIPWNTFGRKNVGFLFAIMHGARRIWDFDDDNQLNFWYRGAEEKAGVQGLDTVVGSLSSQPVLEVNEVVLEADVDVLGRVKEHHFVNPYPLLLCPKKPCWPRGYPLEDIVDSNADHAKVAASTKLSTVPSASVAIIQSLADHEPDVDAMFRLTMGTPFVFGTSGRPNHHLSSALLLLPSSDTFTPLNAQATLHMYSAFWGLLLPHAIPARVSDIWRSYLTERILWDLEGDLRVAFTTSPWVVQDRNNHNLMGDFAAENMLYEDTGAFLAFLRSWECRECADVPSRMQDLWVQAYNRAYLELDDVKSLQLWLKALIDAGYQFPAVKAAYYNKTAPPQQPASLEQAIASRPPTPGKKNNKCGDRVEDLTFLVSDLHDGTRIDMASMLASMNFSVVITGFKEKKTPWPEAWDYPHMTLDKQLMSPVINEYRSRNSQLSNDTIQRHFQYYKDKSTVIESIDVFLCAFPASICELWLPFNKTLAFMPAHRYNLGRCSPAEWLLLDRKLRKMQRDSLDTTGYWPHHIIGAGSRYDKEYLRYYLGEDSKFKLHDWFATGLGYLGRYLDLPYNPTRKEILWTGHRKLPKVTETGLPEMVTEHSLYGHYTAKDLLDHRAVVYYPLSVMSYRLIDFYALGIPLYVPSLKFLRDMNDDRSSTGPGYCRNATLDNYLLADKSNVHPYSPNKEDLTSTFYWAQMADAYTFPHIILFDSYADLRMKLATTDHHKVHRLMVAHSKKRRSKLEEAICAGLEGIDKGRKVPDTYEAELWV